MYFKKTIKSFFPTLKKSINFNLTGYNCPNCISYYNRPTIFTNIIHNKLYHKYQLYAKCTECNLITPAFDDVEKITDILEDYWIDKEVSLFEDD